MSDPRERIDAMMSAYQDATILLTAGRLGVFAALTDPAQPGTSGPARDAGELASELSLEPRPLEIVLLALVAAEILTRDDAGRFALRPELAPLLLPAGADSVASIMNHHFHLLQRWPFLDGVLRTGRPVPREGDRPAPAALRAFICGMKDVSRRSSAEVLEAVDLTGCRRLLDLGGGPATASITFAQRYPELACVVFDLPDVVPIAAEEIAAAGLEDRITTAAGDYHVDDLGSGFDVVYVSNIIHSMGAEETERLFAASAAALGPGGLIVVKDFFLEDSRTEPAWGARFAVNMLVGTEAGKSYTWSETEAALAAAGFGEMVRHAVARHSGIITATRRA